MVPSRPFLLLVPFFPKNAGHTAARIPDLQSTKKWLLLLLLLAVDFAEVII
jgi:hypothetical protein